jgi:RHH-type proline utilization regulon transcriptional repressor/proline dehydrogenase/delta 1-pyrroline-5-carboxylate dehydrogenase
MTELFGPVLGLMRARDLSHAIELANAVPYGLTAGLFSLDDREKKEWMDNIIAGNLYINRTTTGAVVRRQPFGGTKLSSFGNGSKAGGPNYLREFMHISQKGLPKEKRAVNASVNNLTPLLDTLDLSPEKLGFWIASISNYAYAWKQFQGDSDPSQIVGQDNFFYYVPRNNMVLRLGAHSDPFDVLLCLAAMLSCQVLFEISYDSEGSSPLHWSSLSVVTKIIKETDLEFFDRIRSGRVHRVRVVEAASFDLLKVAAEASVHVVDDPVIASGRFELLHYMREVSLSIDYHRYGNLGAREGEARKPS